MNFPTEIIRNVVRSMFGTGATDVAAGNHTHGAGPGAVDWGDIGGTLSDQTDLQGELDGKSDVGHDHDLVYSPLGHNHDLVYSPLGHDHDADYEPLGAVASAISTHEAAVNPHPTYLTQAEGDGLYSVLAHDHDADYEPLGAVATHAGLANPHPVYLTQAEGDALYSVLAHNHDLVYAAIADAYSDEKVDDRVALLIQNGTGITWNYVDGSGTLTPTVTITQYTDAMADVRVAAGIATHNAAGDPHPGYLTPAEGNAAYAAALGADDNYVTDAEKVKLSNLSGTNTGDQTLPVKATGAETDTGTDDAKFLTPKAIEDSSYAKTAAITSAINTHEAAGDPHTGYVLESALNELVDDRVADLLTEGAGVSLTYNDGAGTLEIAISLSAPTMGVSTVDFGVSPGKQQLTLDVTGQTGLISSSKIQAWLQPIATADHGIDDHIAESQFVKVTAFYKVNGTFTLQVETCNPPQTTQRQDGQAERHRLIGQFSIGWSWAN